MVDLPQHSELTHSVSSIEDLSTKELCWRTPRRLDAPFEGHAELVNLELFYDLVYVIIISELAHSLSEASSYVGVAQYWFLFGVVWVLWWNGTSYFAFHGNNDLRTRFFTFVQMFCVLTMATNAHDAFSRGRAGFAIGVGAFELVLAHLWLQTGVADGRHKQAAYPYSASMTLSAFLFMASPLCEHTTRIWLWYAAAGLTVAAPLIVFNVMPYFYPHLHETYGHIFVIHREITYERYSAFIIIVLGEVMVNVLRGFTAHQNVNVFVLLTGALGMLVTICIWWVYFDGIAGKHVPNRSLSMWMYTYAHLILAGAIAASGAGTYQFVKAANQIPITDVTRWMYCASSSVVMLCIAALANIVKTPKGLTCRLYPSLTYAIAGGAVINASVGFTHMGAIPVLSVTLVMMVLPLSVGIAMWVARHRIMRQLKKQQLKGEVGLDTEEGLAATLIMGA